MQSSQNQTLNMLIDEIAIPDDVVVYFQEALSALPDQAVVEAGRVVPALMPGLNQKSPNPQLLRDRINASLPGKRVHLSILNLIRQATLSERFFSALSFRAIDHGGKDWISYFGVIPSLGSLLIDHRKVVREYARIAWEKRSEHVTVHNSVRSPTNHELQAKFAPLLKELSSLITKDSDIAKRPIQAETEPSPPKQTKANLEQEIEKSLMVKRLRRQLDESNSKQELIKKENDRKNLELQQIKEELKEKTLALSLLETTLKQRIADGTSDALKNRLGTWVQPTLELISSKEQNTDPVKRATDLLERQAKQDQRYGTINSLRKELELAESLRGKLKEALNESIRPLAEIREIISTLSEKIAEIELQLASTSINGQSAHLTQVTEKISAIKDIDALIRYKTDLIEQFATHTWAKKDAATALDTINRHLLSLYAKDTNKNLRAQGKIDNVSSLPSIRQSIIAGEECWILIDGHNVLHKIKPFISSSYFANGGRPTGLARSLLVTELKKLVINHPLIQCQIWFDSPIENAEVETENLRIKYSGGSGNNRADRKILESISELSRRKRRIKCFIVTDDRDLLLQALEFDGVAVTPVELWLGLLDTSSQ